VLNDSSAGIGLDLPAPAPIGSGVAAGRCT